MKSRILKIDQRLSTHNQIDYYGIMRLKRDGVENNSIQISRKAWRRLQGSLRTTALTTKMQNRTSNGLLPTIYPTLDVSRCAQDPRLKSDFKTTSQITIVRFARTPLHAALPLASDGVASRFARQRKMLGRRYYIKLCNRDST